METQNGPVVDGVDGFDFQHRQRVASQYQISAVNKSRLKFCIFLHFLLFLVLLLKLSPEILDRLDIFIMELEELMVPKPMLWEYIWAGNLLFAFIGLSAASRNTIGKMHFYALGTFFFGLCPIFYSGWYYYADMMEYAETREVKNVATWQGYPIAVLWYVFIALAFQVHVFSIFFAERLVFAWKARGVKKSQ